MKRVNTSNNCEKIFAKYISDKNNYKQMIKLSKLNNKNSPNF